MGFISRLRVLGDPGLQRQMRSGERWAKILAIGPRIGPRVRLRLEVHEDGKIWEVKLWRTLTPGVKPEVGQDIAWRHGGGQTSNIQYHLQWQQEPQYGTPEADLNALGDEVQRQYTARATAAGEIVTPEQAMDPVDQLQQLVQMRDRGLVSQEQFEESKAGLDDSLAHPDEAMDPQYQLDRLERSHAAGKVSDALYLERKSDIARWIANTQPPTG